MGKNNHDIKTSILHLTPIGGVAEIGSNCTVVENAQEMLIIDYGILFPYDECFNIDYLIANIDEVKNKSKNKKVIIFITHGHEDHIGAIAHLIQDFPESIIYAPLFAAKLIRLKLHQVGLTAKIQIYTQDDTLNFNGFNVHPIKVTHSIPDTYGLIIQDTKRFHSILFISDFKYDLNPLYEIPFQIDHIKSIMSQSQTKTCLIDSTNILDPKKTLSERDLLDNFEALLSQKRRTFITLFSSNIFRLKTILNYAKQFNRTVTPIGRSVQNYLNAAIDSSLLTDSEQSVIRQESEIEDFNSERNIFILTGCQGDHFGALRRVSSGEHRNLKLGTKDLVLFSSKAIPGNAKEISRIYNLITETGAQIITAEDKQIHASGHPGQQDLKMLYEELSPHYIVPIHGESFFLERHYQFILEHNYAKPIKLKNFQSLVFYPNNIVDTFNLYRPEDPKLIQGKLLEVERKAISQRRKIAQLGSVFITVYKSKRKIFVTYAGLPQHLDVHKEKIEKLIKGQLDRKLMQKDDHEISETIRIFTRNLLNNFLSYKPITFVHTI